MIFVGQDEKARFMKQVQDFLIKAKDKVTNEVLIEQLRLFARGERGKGVLWVDARMHLPPPKTYPKQWGKMIEFIDRHLQSGQLGVVANLLQQVGRGEPVSLFD